MNRSTKAAQVVALIHNADALGFFDAANDDILATLAEGLAAETVIGGFDRAARIAEETYGLPRTGLELIADAGLTVHYPLAAAALQFPIARV